jgi:DNA-nicking Smr family endonuclease
MARLPDHSWVAWCGQNVNTTVVAPTTIGPVMARWSALGGSPGVGRFPRQRQVEAAMKLTLDLHDIYNRGDDIERALQAVIEDAVQKKARLIEIIPGKGTGQLKKRVLRFLDQKEIKALYDRVEKDSHNFGRVFVHFRWK